MRAPASSTISAYRSPRCRRSSARLRWAAPGARVGYLAQEPQLRRAIHDLVAKFSGSISAEHGIGRLKRDELAHYASPVALGAMRAIKQALDPNGIMNPGKLL